MAAVAATSLHGSGSNSGSGSVLNRRLTSNGGFLPTLPLSPSAAAEVLPPPPPAPSGPDAAAEPDGAAGSGGVDGGSGTKFCLKWNNFGRNVTAAFKSLLAGESFVDIALSAQGRTLQAHKVVLSASSQYFREILQSLPPWQHPVFVLEVPFDDLQGIVEFIYHGEVSVDQECLASFLKTAQLLKVKGLTDSNEEQASASASAMSLQPVVAGKAERAEQDEDIAEEDDDEEEEEEEAEIEAIPVMPALATKRPNQHHPRKSANPKRTSKASASTLATSRRTTLASDESEDAGEEEEEEEEQGIFAGEIDDREEEEIAAVQAMAVAAAAAQAAQQGGPGVAPTTTSLLQHFMSTTAAAAAAAVAAGNAPVSSSSMAMDTDENNPLPSGLLPVPGGFDPSSFVEPIEPSSLGFSSLKPPSFAMMAAAAAAAANSSVGVSNSTTITTSSTPASSIPSASNAGNASNASGSAASNGSQKKTCPYCNQQLSWHALSRHIRDMHRAKSGFVTCKYCFKMFRNKNSLGCHMWRFHKEQNGRGSSEQRVTPPAGQNSTKEEGKEEVNIA